MLYDGALVGDFNEDTNVDADDIDLLCRNLGSADSTFDLNGDQIVSVADHDFLIDQVLTVLRGDANLDGIFNSSDLVVAFQHAQYEDDTQNNSGWSAGDWNCDGDFTTSDLVVAFQSGSYVAASHVPSTDTKRQGSVNRSQVRARMRP